MNAMKRIVLGVSLVLAVALAFVTVRAASSSQEPDPQAAEAVAGTGFTYQGRLRLDSAPVDVECRMLFGLFDGAGPTARQIGETLSRQVVPTGDGLFTVYLDFGSAAFRGYARWLDIAVQCPGDRDPVVLGRQELTAAPFALYALDAPWGGLPYAGVVIVAKSGGDFSSIQDAIASIDDAAADSPYLVWVAPGVYEEQVTMEPYIHLQGAGQEATVVTSDVGGADFPPEQATLILANHTSVRDLSAVNVGTADYNVALLAPTGSEDVLVADLTAQAQGAGSNNFGCSLHSDGEVILQQVIALGENASEGNCGLVANLSMGMVRLNGGLFVGRGGHSASGIEAATALYAEGVTALAEQEGSPNPSYGLYLKIGAHAELGGGSFTARGDGVSFGIYNDAGFLDAYGVVALGDGAYGTGLYNTATSKLVGGSFTGTSTEYGSQGLVNEGILSADSVTALGQNGMHNHGLLNQTAGQATLRGGSFTGSGGGSALGIANQHGLTVLEADGVTAVGEGASDTNYGLFNYQQCDAFVRGSTLIGQGGTNAYGLYNHLSAEADVTQSVLYGGTYAVFLEGGSMIVSNGRLKGGVEDTETSVTCVAVTEDATFYESTCPPGGGTP